MILLPASDFSVDELTEAYNQTRTDYLIPMPMNSGRMQEYIDLYDVDLSDSWVAVVGDNIVGLGMLGVRPGLGWITRLGVLPEGRRQKVGTRILQGLIERANQKHLQEIWLEVIKDNTPAHELFRGFGFRETRELIVARRPPRAARNMATLLKSHRIQYLQHDEVIELHCQRRERANWLNSIDTMKNVRRSTNPPEGDSLHESSHMSGMFVDFQDGSQGWISYQATTLQIKRISVEVIRGDEVQTTANLLSCMHRLHAAQDAIIENIPDDERWAGYRQVGYFEVFRRIEMVRGLMQTDRKSVV